MGGGKKGKFMVSIPVPVDSVNLVLSYLFEFRCQNDAGKGKKAFKEKCICKEGKKKTKNPKPCLSCKGSWNIL